jgi:hypothetical protein
MSGFKRPRRDTRAHRRRMISRCHRKIVPGVTISGIAARRPPAASLRAAPATPGPATPDANKHEAAHAGRQPADGAASRSPRPSTTTPGATSPAPTRHGTRSGRPASSPQAEDRPTFGPTKTCLPGTRTRNRADHDLQSICARGPGFRHPHPAAPLSSDLAAQSLLVGRRARLEATQDLDLGPALGRAALDVVLWGLVAPALSRAVPTTFR